MEFLIGALILGLLPAAVAHSRGLPFVTWWLYGALIWPVALVHVFFAKPGAVTIAGETGPRTCPFCAELILPAAKVCKHCHRDLPVAAAAPPRRSPRAYRARASWWDGEMPAWVVVAGVVAVLILIVSAMAVMWMSSQ